MYKNTRRPCYVMYLKGLMAIVFESSEPLHSANGCVGAIPLPTELSDIFVAFNH